MYCHFIFVHSNVIFHIFIVIFLFPWVTRSLLLSAKYSSITCLVIMLLVVVRCIATLARVPHGKTHCLICMWLMARLLLVSFELPPEQICLVVDGAYLVKLRKKKLLEFANTNISIILIFFLKQFVFVQQYCAYFGC